MHLITGVLTKKKKRSNRSLAAFAQGSGFGEESEMITACKSRHKIESYYPRRTNGLFNATLMVFCTN